MSLVWEFFQRQILGMAWLDMAVGALLGALGIDSDAATPAGRLGASLRFFLYDTIKILVLLSTLIFVISYIQSHFPPERTKRILGRFHGIGANIASALLGTLTPFCSCSSIPLFIGFTNAGLPVGVTFSFLISSPLVDLGALVLLTGTFGIRLAVAYVLLGLVLAVAGGSMLDRLGMERYVQRFPAPAQVADPEGFEMTRKDRLIFARDQMLETLHRVWIYVLVGVAIGALIHNWIPEAWIQSALGTENPFSVLLATAVGVPMYADIFGTIPIAEALYSKGVGPGTILALMMAVTALSLPSMILLSRVVKTKLLVTFVAIVTAGILIIGYAFNAFAFFIL